MSFRNRTGRLAAAFLMSLSLAACSAAPAEDSAAGSDASGTETAETVKIMAPQGAPALAVLGAEEDENTIIDYVNGQDVLISELAKSDSECDLIAAPVNLGVKSWSEAENYELAGVLTWGNLYIVAGDENWNEEGKTLAAFGEGAVPGMVFSKLYPETACEVVYYPSVAEAGQAVGSGKADAALLAQPAAAGIIGKSEGSLEIVEDIQTMWQEQNGTDEKGYPQAGLFIKKGSEEKAAQIVKNIQAWIESADDNTLTNAMEKAGVENLGVPSIEVAVKTWPAQNIHFKNAAESEEDLKTFLSLFGMELPENMLADIQ